jgi:hypothetical protein
MTRRQQIVAMFAAVVVASSVGATSALAKDLCSRTHDGKHGCANEIRMCWAVSLCKDASVKGKARTACIRRCRDDVVDRCHKHEIDCTLSPSGAFLSPVD